MNHVMRQTVIKYTRDEELKIVSMRKAGSTIDEVATEMKRRPSQIKQKLCRMGWSTAEKAGV